MGSLLLFAGLVLLVAAMFSGGLTAVPGLVCCVLGLIIGD